MASLPKPKPSLFNFPPLRLLSSHCRQRLLPPNSQKRLLTTQNRVFTDGLLKGLEDLNKSSPSTEFASRVTKALGAVSSKLGNSSKQSLDSPSKGSPLSKFTAPLSHDREPPPHHLHVYSTKHNCHITLSDGKRQPLISVSAGNIGFRKAARGSYDAAYQLGAYVMGRIIHQGLLRDIHALEVILRDFGPGREAFQKILMGNEGRLVRGTVVRVMDATRLKFGGTRSKKPRRLG